MDENMKQFLQGLIELETEGEHLLLARHQLVENDKMRNGNREALTALRKRARTTKTSAPSPFESMMKNIGNPGSMPLVKEVCETCGNHDSNERTWMMFPRTDVFAKIPFHAAHIILERFGGANQAKLDHEAKKLQSYVKEKSLLISEKGVLADKISPAVLRSLVMLKDKPCSFSHRFVHISLHSFYDNRSWTADCSVTYSAWEAGYTVHIIDSWFIFSLY
ncbi:hypothetical protein CRYUN_Cryun01aG0247400 [Craigia yunnanensis]